MNLTLLLDLDDTLLVNNIDDFLPAYLQAFARFMEHAIPSNRFIQALLAGTERMVKNRLPDCTLREVFEETFYPTSGLQPAEFERLAEHFYAEVFPSLRGLTRSNPAARQVVEQALERGYDLVIATDPLFPRSAVEQRLAWANLPVEKYAFKLVPSYDTVHFSKSEPAYYAELLASLGWPDGPILMVGDNPERDIATAAKMGLATYWIIPNGRQTGSIVSTAAGELGDLIPWIDRMQQQDLQPDFATPDAMLAILRATPAALDSLCRGLALSTWNQHPEKDEWCLNEIVCHLRDVEAQVNLPRLQQLLEQVNPFMPGMDTDAWAVERNYHEQDGPAALRRFTASRLEMLDRLESLPPEAWSRLARHAIFGPTTLEELVGITASHDRLHLKQVMQTLAAILPEKALQAPDYLVN